MRLGQLQSLLAVDEAVERVMAAVDASGHARDTVVVFTSDNGFSWNEHRWVGKQCPYEECLRVPLVIRFPLLGDGGREEPRMALNVDLAPTIAHLAGVPVPADVDGRSLVPLLRGSAGRWRVAFLIEYFALAAFDPPSFAGIRTKRWKLIRYADPSDDQLLDLAADPFELESMRPARRPIARRLERYLQKLRGAAADSGRVTIGDDATARDPGQPAPETRR
jgi:arylsulfatase A-like enzyme